MLILESLLEKKEATRILLEIEMLEAFILEGSSYFEALSQASAVWGYPLLSISTREPFLPTSGLGPRGSWLNPLVPHRHCTRHHFKANQPGAAQPTSMTTVVDPTTTEGHTESMWEVSLEYIAL